jgi:hypothetical protein
MAAVWVTGILGHSTNSVLGSLACEGEGVGYSPHQCVWGETCLVALAWILFFHTSRCGTLVRCECMGRMIDAVPWTGLNFDVNYPRPHRRGYKGMKSNLSPGPV